MSVDVGSAPNQIVAADGSLWVAEHRGNNAVRIDPSTGRVTRIPLQQESCWVADGYGRAWFTPCNGGGTRSITVDAGTDQVAGTVPGLVSYVGFGSVWSSDSGHIDRIDPSSGHVTANVTGNGYYLVGDDQRLFDVDIDNQGSFSGEIRQIDPRSDKTVKIIKPSPTAETDDPFVVPYGNNLWIKYKDDVLQRVDLTTGKTTTMHLAGFVAPSEFYDVPIAAGEGSLWVRLDQRTVVRLDPTSGRVQGRFPADPAANGGYLTVAFGSLWMTNAGDDSIWRVVIPHTG